MNKGITAAIGAYLLWGFLPIYWKWLHAVPAGEILAHRIIWSLALLIVFQSLRKDWQWLRPSLHNRRILVTFILAALLLSANWFLYIWAVNANYVIETSLGYFINPLVYIVLGVLFLRERLRLDQWAAVGLAAAGVLYLTFRFGQLPWIALALAFSFGFYGFLKKLGALSSLRGLTLETAAMSLPALFYLLWLGTQGQGTFGGQNGLLSLLLIFAGPVTSIPLVLFGVGARQIPLYMLGFLQYLAPTIQFLLGLWVFKEPFSPDRLVGFALIWTALLIYSVGEFIVWKRRSAIHKADS